MNYLKERNIIAFDDANRAPLQSNIQSGNLPELMLAATGSNESNLCSNSSHTKLDRRYDILVSTSDLRITKLLYPLEFAILASLTRWQMELGKLTWQGDNFVTKLNLLTSKQGISDPKLNRGINGWTVVQSIYVEMHFRTSLLQGYI